MCPCGYLTAWHTLRLWKKRSRREANIITGKNERSQRKCVNFKVGLSVFRVTSFWLCWMPATQRVFGRTTCHHTPGNEKKNWTREVFSLVTPFVMMWYDMCSSFQSYGIFSLLDRHHSPLWQSKPADACNCDFSRFSWSGCHKRIIILCENYLAGIFFIT